MRQWLVDEIQCKQNDVTLQYTGSIKLHVHVLANLLSSNGRICLVLIGRWTYKNIQYHWWINHKANATAIAIKNLIDN